ncbi:MAG: PmoA family protein [Gemmataceae bacterium]
MRRSRRTVLGVLIGGLLVVAGGRAADDTKGIAGRRLTIQDKGAVVTVEQDGKPLLRYRTVGKGHKPYVLELTTPAGVNVLRDAPFDHLHHHGLMFACRVNGVNFWEEPADSGRQVHQKWVTKTVRQVGDAEEVVLTEALVWQDKSGKALLEEERTLTVPERRSGVVPVLTWKTTLKPAGSAAATLTGAVYHGLGCRFPKPMDVGGRFFNATGASGPAAKLLGTQAAWCAYTAAPAAGKPVTVALLDEPTNPRAPATWYPKDDGFAYLSATLGLDKKSLKVSADKPLTLRYGVIAVDGVATKAAIEAAYDAWRGK